MTYIYSNKSPSGYYVYAYLRSSDGTPYYIGKGAGDRAFDKSSHDVKPPKNKSLIVFIETKLTELGAFARERELIRWYGRKDTGTGILRNRTDGGEGVSGLVPTLEHRQKLSQANKRRPPASIETREKLRQNRKGKKHTVESRKNMVESTLGMCFWNNGVRNTTSKECPGPGWVKGRLISNQHSQAIIASNKSRIRTAEQKQKASLTQIGRRWFNNGVVNTVAHDPPGPEWVEGRLPPKSMKGILKSDSTREKMREAWKLRKQKKGRDFSRPCKLGASLENSQHS